MRERECERESCVKVCEKRNLIWEMMLSGRQKMRMGLREFTRSRSRNFILSTTNQPILIKELPGPLMYLFEGCIDVMWEELEKFGTGIRLRV